MWGTAYGMVRSSCSQHLSISACGHQLTMSGASSMNEKSKTR